MINKPASPQQHGSLPEVCLNLWYVVDASGFAYRLSGRAYSLTGTETEKLHILHGLSATDFYVAKMFPVPNRYTVSDGESKTPGMVTPAVIHMEISNVFQEVIDSLEACLPIQMREINGEAEKFKLKIPGEPLMVLTAIREDEYGNLTPMIAANPA